MKKVLIRYKIKESKVAENELLVSAVYDELNRNQIQGFHYCTFKLQDGASFVHIAFSDNDEANVEFNQLPAFKKFQLDIKARCEEPPVVNTVSIAGSYKFEI